MTATLAAALVAAVIIAVVAWAVLTARRLDRLHIRVDRSLASLNAALDRRMAVIAAVAPELADGAREAETMPLTPGRFEERMGKERAVVGDVDKRPGIDRASLADADERVMLAARFYNDAVADTRALRLKPAVRAARLAGTARLPEFFPLADVVASAGAGGNGREWN